MNVPNYSQIIDISIPLKTGMIVYPGNPEVEIEEIKSASGSSVISKITLGSHTGTHMDAPSHVIPGAATLTELSLETFVGTCRVIDCTNEQGAVSLEWIERKNIQQGERILLKTQNCLDGYESFNNDFVYLSSAAAEYLAEKVVLIGIDYLSIKQKGSTDNIPHTAFLKKNIPILEGLDVSKVEEGSYFLSALPLKFEGLDGSPIRAVLLK